jgi:hypothetical protein
MNLEFGNAWERSTVNAKGDKTGWFVGRFPEIKAGGYTGLRVSSDAEVKWFEHPKGQESGARSISTGLSLSILIEGLFALWFCEPDENGQPDGNWQRYLLKYKGDYLIWGAGLFHRWQALESSVVLSVRPTPKPAPSPSPLTPCP